MISRSALYYYLITILCVTSVLIASEQNEGNSSLNKSQIHSVGSFDGNNIHSDLENTGMFVSHRISGHSGLEWPAGGQVYSVYAAGLWFAGLVNGEVRTAVAEYGPEFTPGPYSSDGTDPTDRLYKVNVTDISDPESNPDFAAWPIHQGAPWVDEDGDGIYTPLPEGPDHPDFIGDQVIYFVMNDGVADDHNIFNTEPLGIEVRMTIWGYNQYFDFLDDVMFIKAQVYNRGGNDIDSLYVGVWSDPDLGNGSDDWVGCDVARSLGFCYNDGSDSNYGEVPPAVGFDLLQVAIPTGNQADELYCFNELKPGYASLPMSAFIKYIGSHDIYTDPNDRLEAYAYLQGLRRDGSPFINSATGEATKFVASGDPNQNFDDADNIWVDGDDNPSDDRRMLQSSGPITFTSGDSIEVVTALLHGQGVSALSSVTSLKHTADVVQSLFSNNFIRATLSPIPETVATPASGKIILEWDDQAESYSAGMVYPYTFEGYNIYQHVSSDSSSNQIRLATFDLINGVRRIWDDVYESDVGEFIFRPVQFGTDSGIQRYLVIQKDALNGNAGLIDDREYYFSVTSYGYNGLMSPATLESESQIIAVRPQTNANDDPQLETDSDIPLTHIGVANADVSVKVINPSQLTGDEYTVYFDQQHYYRNLEGLWLKTAYADSIGKLSKVSDLTGTEITGAAIVSADAGTIDLVFSLSYISPDGAFIDGFEVDFADDVTINSMGTIEGLYNSYGAGSGQNEVNGSGILAAGNVITWGDSTRSTFGGIEGDITVVINVDPISFPQVVGYKVFDDGYGTLVDIAGTITIPELGYDYLTIKHWNLKNLAGSILLEDMTTLDGYQYDYIDNAGILHEFGRHYVDRYYEDGLNVGTGNIPIIDGFQVNVAGSYAVPIKFNSITLTENPLGGTVLSEYGETSHLDIQNYTIFGGIITSFVVDYFGVGTRSIESLQQDLELRFTGVLDTTVVNGQTLISVSEGGSMATMFHNQDGFDQHPLGGGATSEFMLRVPFEVWNVDLGIQVNLAFRDRIQVFDAEPYYAWNMVNRMYACIVNTPYDPDTPIPGIWDGVADPLSDEATWVLVFYGTNYNLGDVVFITYDNPIRQGVDEFKFTPVAPIAKSFDEDNIKVWPNPYFAWNPEEQSYFDSRIHFINLPDEATITIVNLAGQVVRILNHSGSQEEIWDVRNSHNNMVTSGVYLAIVEMAEGTKVLKLAVVVRKM